MSTEGAGFGNSPTPRFMMTRRQVFDHLLAGGEREGLPVAFIQDYERSRPYWSGSSCEERPSGRFSQTRCHQIRNHGAADLAPITIYRKSHE